MVEIARPWLITIVNTPIHLFTSSSLSSLLRLSPATHYLPALIPRSHCSRPTDRPSPSRHPRQPLFRPQIARAKEVKAHYLSKQAHEAKSQREYAERAANGVVVSLGLVEQEPEK